MNLLTVNVILYHKRSLFQPFFLETNVCESLPIFEGLFTAEKLDNYGWSHEWVDIKIK